jgi:hypothetical protein
MPASYGKGTQLSSEQNLYKPVHFGGNWNMRSSRVGFSMLLAIVCGSATFFGANSFAPACDHGFPCCHYWKLNNQFNSATDWQNNASQGGEAYNSAYGNDSGHDVGAEDAAVATLEEQGGQEEYYFDKQSYLNDYENGIYTQEGSQYEATYDDRPTVDDQTSDNSSYTEQDQFGFETQMTYEEGAAGNQEQAAVDANLDDSYSYAQEEAFADSYAQEEAAAEQYTYEDEFAANNENTQSEDAAVDSQWYGQEDDLYTYKPYSTSDEFAENQASYDESNLTDEENYFGYELADPMQQYGNLVDPEYGMEEAYSENVEESAPVLEDEIPLENEESVIDMQGQTNSPSLIEMVRNWAAQSLVGVKVACRDITQGISILHQ